MKTKKGSVFSVLFLTLMIFLFLENKALAVTVTKVSAGKVHTCALLSDGTVKCWGRNNEGELGIGTNSGPDTCGAWPCSKSPVSVSGISSAVDISAGWFHTCVVLSDRTIKCWGSNGYGRLGDGTTIDAYSPISVTGINSAQNVSSGDGHTCTMLLDGTVKCWGDNNAGSLGDGTTTNSSVPVSVSGINTAMGIAIGGGEGVGKDSTCALLSDGTAKSWGYNYYGSLGMGTNIGPETCNGYACSKTPVQVNGITDILSISISSIFGCAVLSGGNIKCWGANSQGELGNGTYTTSYTPVSVSGIANATKLSLGDMHACAILSDGTLKCWGWGGIGQLGNGANTSSNIPVSVSGITNVTQVSAGYNHTCAVVSDVTVKCWGNNDVGQLGIGTTVNSNTPRTTLLDLTPPTSSVTSLSAYKNTTSFSVSWSGSDSGGSGLKCYDVQYKVGSTGTWTDWQSCVTATSATFGPTSPVTVTDGTTYYFQSRAQDNDGNIETYPGGDGDTNTTIDLNTPSSSVSALSTYQTATSFSVSWSGSDTGASGLKCYDVQYKAGSTGTWTTWNSCVTSTSATFGPTSPVTVASGTTYYFQSRAQDNAGNTESYPGGSGDASTMVDVTNPSVSSLTSSTHADQSKTYSSNTPAYAWTASDAQSGVINYYYLFDGTSTHTAAEVQSGGAQTTAASFTASAQSDGVYYFHLIAKDNAGNSSNVSTYTTRIDTTAPTISSVTSGSITNSTAIISWATSEAATSQVEYGTTTAYGSSTTLDTNLVSSHSISLSGLTASSLYHYRVKSKDAAGNEQISDDNTFTTTATADATAPTISSVTAGNVTSSSSTITWTTNEASDSKVDYGTTTSYGSAATNANMATSHSIALTGLSAGTLYNYKVTSKDASNNSASSANYQFTTTASDTTPPVISGLSSGTPTYNAVALTSTTNESAVCNVDYGVTTSYGTSSNYETTYAASHSITLSGLTGSTAYNYIINCKDASGNAASSTNNTFTTSAPPDTTAPVITSGPSATTTSNSAIVSWTTDETATSVVYYGTTDSYELGNVSDTTLLKSHSAGLTSLTANTTYNYKVCSSDTYGNGPTCSANTTFQTTSTNDTTAPVVSTTTVSTGMTTATGVTITFTTGELSVCQIKYGATTSYGLETNFETSYVTSHSITLSNLSSSTTYHYSIVCKDASANAGTGTTDNTVATTGASDTAPPQSSAYISSQVQSTTTFTVTWFGTDNKTNSANLIYDIQVKDGTTGTWTDWKTSVPGTQVSADYTGENGHTYYFRNRSKDEAGNVESYPDEADTFTLVQKSEQKQNPSTMPVSLWGIVSFPIEPDDPGIGAVIADDISDINQDYTSTSQLSYWDPNAKVDDACSGCSRYKHASVISVGQGYWLRPSSAAGNASVDVQGKPVDQSVIYDKIKIYAGDNNNGWNMIGNPYLFNVDWKDVKVRAQGEEKSLTDAIAAGWISGTLYSYEKVSGAYTYVKMTDADGVLEPWKGYYMKAKALCELVFQPVASKKKGFDTADIFTQAKKLSEINDGFVMQISARASQFGDLFNYFGVSKEASDGEDKYDLEEPPNVSPYVSLYFIGKSMKYDQEIKNREAGSGAGTSGKTWSMVVETDIKGANVELRWNPLGADATVKVALLDVSANALIDMKQNSTYTFYSGNGGQRQFKIFYGEDIVEKEIQKRTGPAALLETYTAPNPYRGAGSQSTVDAKGKISSLGSGVTFKYKLGGQVVRVGIEVYTMSGKLIDRFDGDLSGSTTWGYGDSLANGVYIYRITAYDAEGNNVSKINKLVVIK